MNGGGGAGRGRCECALGASSLNGCGGVAAVVLEGWMQKKINNNPKMTASLVTLDASHGSLWTFLLQIPAGMLCWLLSALLQHALCHSRLQITHTDMRSLSTASYRALGPGPTWPTGQMHGKASYVLSVMYCFQSGF